MVVVSRLCALGVIANVKECFILMLLLLSTAFIKKHHLGKDATDFTIKSVPRWSFFTHVKFINNIGGLTQGADKPVRRDQHLHKSKFCISACVSKLLKELLTAEMVNRWIPTAIHRAVWLLLFGHFHSL